MITLVSRIFWLRARFRLGAEKAAQRGEIQQFAFGRAGHRANIGKEQHAHNLREMDDVRSIAANAAEHQTHQRGAEQPGSDAEDHADEPLQADALDPALQHNGKQAESRAHKRRRPEVLFRRPEVPGGKAQNHYE